MELRHIRYFIAVAEELNFTRAAARLNTAQPSLSQQIQDLEHEVGAPLLTRTKRSVALTAAGRVFLDEARLTLAQSRRTLANARRAAELDGDILTIGFVPAAEIKIFPHILTALRARFPKLKLEFQSITSLEQREALSRGDIDLAFLTGPVQEPGLKSQLVLRERLMAVLPANSPLAAQSPVSLAELSAEPFLEISPRHGGALVDIIRDSVKAQGLTFQTAQQADNVLTLLTLIGLGVGFSLLPDYAESLMFRNVAARPLTGPAIHVDLLMAWRDEDQTPENAAFRDLVIQTTKLS